MTDASSVTPRVTVPEQSGAVQAVGADQRRRGEVAGRPTVPQRRRCRHLRQAGRLPGTHCSACDPGGLGAPVFANRMPLVEHIAGRPSHRSFDVDSQANLATADAVESYGVAPLLSACSNVPVSPLLPRPGAKITHAGDRDAPASRRAGRAGRRLERAHGGRARERAGRCEQFSTEASMLLRNPGQWRIPCMQQLGSPSPAQLQGDAAVRPQMTNPSVRLPE